MNSALSNKITVIITTKDRGDSVLGALDSIFANKNENFKIILVDQSNDNSTKEAVSVYSSKSNFLYIPSDSFGLSSGRNLAIKHADSEILAITDDDCVVSMNWMENIRKAFKINDKIGIVYGMVEPGEGIKQNQFVTTYLCENPYISKSIYFKYSMQGLGACMGIKKSLWEQLNGFDCMLGAGSLFSSCEDTDFNIRALLKGYYVYYTPDVSIMHLGYRNKEQAQKLICGYSYGNGALFAKHIKCGHYGMLLVLARQLVNWAFGSSWVMTSVENQGNKTGRAASFLKGLYNGFITPINKARGHFKYP